MADKEEKTEEPTSKKLGEARRKGEVASSQEFKTWTMFLATTALCITASNWLLGSIGHRMAVFLGTLEEVRFETTGIIVPIRELVVDVGMLMAVPLTVFLLAALLGNRMQNEFVFAVEKLKPDIKKVNPVSGFKRLFSVNNLVELGKAIVKISIVGAVVFAIIWPERARLDSMMFVPLPNVVEYVVVMITQLFIGVTLLMTAIAAIDYTWQNYQYRKSLRMTKQEVKDEHKQTDGDPKVKGRLRAIRRERFARRLAAIIPQSDVVITNPTHYAVALNYKHGEMMVPVIAAKGVDHLARRIRELADDHGIPIVENPPLARALYAHGEIDEEIPADQYRAVAEVISYVMKLSRAGLGYQRSAAAPEPLDMY